MGPYLMPHFTRTRSTSTISTRSPRTSCGPGIPTTPADGGSTTSGRFPEGMVAWFIGLIALVIVARLIGERMA